MAGSERPWTLEVQEESVLQGGVVWNTWSTYREKGNAVERQTKLRGKGYDARVVNTVTGEVVGAPGDLEPCPFCGSQHAGPQDGSCLL